MPKDTQTGADIRRALARKAARKPTPTPTSSPEPTPVQPQSAAESKEN